MNKPNVGQVNPLSPRGFPQATVVCCRWQKVTLALLLVLLVVWAISDWRTELFWLNAVCTGFYLLATLYRLLLIHLAFRRGREIQISPDELAAAPEGKWPRYLVLVPAYREGAILPELVASLGKLDYPADRLEIRLLLEEDDHETRACLAKLSLPPQFRPVLVPPSQPRTKPKACNVGMEGAEANYLVIYDAEDRPEPDQLKKAVVAFSRCSAEVVCIQAKLGYYNTATNWMSRCFGAEYATWFGLCLPGLDCLQAPIPLGGTSNHFRLAALREVGGWDEYNVTEDCDLGMRLHEHGWRTRILESTTWEQACCHLPAWLRQRSRWVKGYIQTYLVHTRNLFGLHRQLGLWDSLQFHLLIGGTFASLLLNPIYWLITLLWLCLRPEGGDAFFPLPIFLMSAFCLFVGNFIFLYTTVLACLRREVGHLASTCLTMPFYWLLMSLGAWKGACQLLWKAHFWEKTTHVRNPDAATVTAAPAPQVSATPAASAPPKASKKGSQVNSASSPKPRAAAKPAAWPGVTVTAVLLVLGVLLYQGMSFDSLPEMRFHQLIAAYLEAGHLWGGHALVGIADLPPLPTLAVLIFNLLGRLLRLDGVRLLCVLCQLGCLWHLFRWFTKVRNKQNLLMLVPLLLWAAASHATAAVSVANPAWLTALLLCGLWRHLAVWEENRQINPLVAAALHAAALTLCGPSGLALSAALLLLLTIAIRTGKDDSRGQTTLLWLPWCYTFGVLLLWNWLLFGDFLFFLRESLSSWQFTALRLPSSWTALTHNRWLSVLAVLAYLTAFSRRPWSSACLLLSTAVLTLSLWMGQATCGRAECLAICAGVLLNLAVLLQLLLARLRTLDWKAILPLVLLTAWFLVATASKPDNDGWTLRSEDSPVTINELETARRVLDSQGRIRIYGAHLPLLFFDSEEKLFCPRLRLDEAELREAACYEELFLLLAPPESPWGSGPQSALTDIHDFGRPWLLLENEWRGWQLWKVLPADTAP